jgi:hypothetical protein
MRKLISISFVLLLAAALLYPQDMIVIRRKAAAASCSTPAQGNVLSAEGFETATTGYERTGWQTATGSPNPYYDTTSLTTSKPNGACNRAFLSTYSVSNEYHWNIWDSGSDHSSTLYTRLYLYVASHTIDPAENATIGGVYNHQSATNGYRVCTMQLAYPSSQLVLRGNGATTSSNINISTGQWYRVEMKCVPNGTSEIVVDGGTPQTFTATGYTSWRALAIGSNIVSSQQYAYHSIVADLLAADSSGYIGAVP